MGNGDAPPGDQPPDRLCTGKAPFQGDGALASHGIIGEHHLYPGLTPEFIKRGGHILRGNVERHGTFAGGACRGYGQDHG